MKFKVYLLLTHPLSPLVTKRSHLLSGLNHWMSLGVDKLQKHPTVLSLEVMYIFVIEYLKDSRGQCWASGSHWGYRED